MNIAAALIYWVIVALWAAVLGRVIYLYVRNPHAFGTTRLLLAVVGLDTFRNIFENCYFGLYFGGKYGIFPPAVVATLGNPLLIIIPKILNVVAGSVVLGLLLFRWLPLAVKERRSAERRVGEMEALAGTDSLTGIYNRRQFETLAVAELSRSLRYRRPLAILMIDVDFFKSVNDRFGHAVGDRTLQAVAAICRDAKRESDILARIGGEEFAMLLSDTPADSAVIVAERLRRQVGEWSTTVDSEMLRVTVSIGIAGATAGHDDVAALLRRADEALYLAKRAGRNQVAMSLVEPSQDELVVGHA